ncbi:mitochondrial intermembrane space import and assembly protein 40 [Colletotrichum truncatum]|uniref:Mitochondrial intermembrane space import and assembly protein 40 n=1 Tax=Colletotrichum truncatum TaxID=5467 RepID=A0ACC3ZLF1_COLTU|nr:mitochondrial intermembrane space import and assembly protein 40 [Colletotrichum truncatum]KAF6783946.1 mitochondrial intermembrane space import and assembly protein 40 [Colletotrichum truncatum]
MYRSAVRSTPRALSAARQSAIRAAPRRFASTTPADKPRSWKGSALRWGLAIGAIYWYNTSPVFAEEPIARTIPAPSQFSESDLTTVDAIVEEKRKRAIVKAEEPKPKPAAAAAAPAAATTADSAEAADKTQATEAEGAPAPGSPQALQEEADQQGAFNPETGEINWDCPCLGGMADGPCGEEFKAAFSCFVYSTEEPKGMDCIEKFQGMQECFRKYPEIYGAELADDEAPEDAQPILDANADASVTPPTHAVEDKKEDQKETTADSPDQAPRAEIKSDTEVKKIELKPEAEKKKEEAKQAASANETVDLTKPNNKATDATAANEN